MFNVMWPRLRCRPQKPPGILSAGHITGEGTLHRQPFLGQSAPSTYQWKRLATPPLSSATLLWMKFSSENHSGDVNNHSGRTGISSSISARNHYSHRVGIVIHITPERLFTCPGIRTRRRARTGLAHGLAHVPHWKYLSYRRMGRNS